MMLPFKAASLDDLRVVSSWVTNQHETDFWAGGRVGYPIDWDQMMEVILWSEATNLVLGAGQPLAFGQILPKEGGRRHLARLIVHPDRRGEGLGGQLVAGLLETALGLGASVVSLNVDPLNGTAIRLYERIGFRANAASPNTTNPRFVYMEYTY